MKRTYLKVGEFIRNDNPAIMRAIDTELVFDVKPGDKVGFSQGYALKEFIREFGIPNVDAYAIGGVGSFGVYGVQAHYKNGRARVYVVDVGTELIPVVSDFWEGE